MKQYVMDENGEKTAVIMDLEEFKRLMTHIEEMEDALDLKGAVETSGEFMDLKDFVAELKKEDRV